MQPDLWDPRRILRGRVTGLVLLDAILVAAGIGAVLLSSRVDGPEPDPGWLIAYGVTVIAMLAFFRMYRPRFVVQPLDDSRTIVGATAVAAVAVTFARVLVGGDPEAATEAVRIWLFATVYLIAGRGGLQLVQLRMRRRGAAGDPTLIVGAGRIGQFVAARLAERPELGLRAVAFFDHDPLELENGASLPVIGRGTHGEDDPAVFADQIEEVVTKLGVMHVILTFSLASHEVELALIRRCQELGATVSLVPRLFEGLPDEIELQRLGGLPVVTVYAADPRGWQFAVKYVVDRLLATIMIVVVSPVLLLCTLGVLVSLGRPILFRQARVGIDGRGFDMLKFRTMRPAPESIDGVLEEDLERGLAPGGIEGDDRRTGVGSFLRSSSLDELPQLFNVLRGEMSLIGPRPERPEFADRFRHDVHRYADRLRVKSGITGWAQVHGLRGRTSIADRVEWDNYYIENWSLWLDFKIFLLTLLVVLRGRSE